MTCDFVGRGGGRKDLGVGGEGVGDILVIKKRKGGRIWVLGVGGVLVFRISVTVGFTGCVHVLLQPFPFPHVSLMYINPDSRGQCVLGEVKLLSSQSIAFNLHSSACGPHSGPEMCVLLFQRRAVYLELIRGTHTGASGLEYTCMSVYMLFFNLCMCVHLYLCGRQSVSFLCSFIMGCNICHAKNLKPFLTD